MRRFAPEFYEIAASEVAQHNVVRGIMAKAFSDAGGDEKKAIAYYIEYRAGQLAQGTREELRQKRLAAREELRQKRRAAREELRQKRRAATVAAAATGAAKQRQRAILGGFRQSAYGLLSGVLWFLALFPFVSGAALLFYVLNQWTKSEPDPNVGPAMFGFFVSAFSLIACVYLAIKSYKASARK